jgi:hypothetical protein
MPVTGHYIETGPMLAIGLTLRPAAIAPLLEMAVGRPSRTADGAPAIAAGEASPELLDAVARMLRLLDHPADAAVLAPWSNGKFSGDCSSARSVM